MSESTLSLTYSDLRRIIGRFLGYGTNTALWTAAQVIEVTDIIKSGLNQFYFPPSLQAGEPSHQWSFLKKNANITCVVDYSTGTISSSSTTVTLTTGTWPSWAATNGTLVVDGIEYDVTVRNSGSIITIATAPTVAFSADSFTLEHDGNYELLDEFGALDGIITFADDLIYQPIRIVSEKEIRKQRSRDDFSGTVYMAAVRSFSEPGATEGQRFELLLYPRPNTEWVITYRYCVYPNIIDSSTNVYPFGGLAHMETILESVLSIAEQRGDDTIGLHTQKFTERLMASIAYDLENSPDFYGYNSDNSDGDNDYIYNRVNSITVNNTQVY
jgi:hypothetical protein